MPCRMIFLLRLVKEIFYGLLDSDVLKRQNEVINVKAFRLCKRHKFLYLARGEMRSVRNKLENHQYHDLNLQLVISLSNGVSNVFSSK